MNTLCSFTFSTLLALFFSNSALANEQAPQFGGVYLEFPQGRFQENSAPSFFKWNLQTRTASIALKVFRCDGPCNAYSKKELVARFDFLPDVQSMNWFGEALPVGHYTWSIEAFDQSKTNPVFSDTATFSIEPIRSYGFKTDRIGLLAGFARGDYNSGDDNYNVDFRTTPTTYGVSYGGGSQTRIWNAEFFFSDFILRGRLYNTTTFLLEHLWHLNVSDPKRLLFFLGPSAKYLSFPEVTSLNGTDLNIKTEWIASPGIVVKAQYDVDKYLAAQMSVSYDVAVAGANSVNVDLKNGSFNTSLGLTYGKLWPVGLSSEIQYQSDLISTTPAGGGPVDIKQNQWVILFHLFYAI